MFAGRVRLIGIIITKISPLNKSTMIKLRDLNKTYPGAVPLHVLKDRLWSAHSWRRRNLWSQP